MPGMLGVLGVHPPSLDEDALAETIDLLGTARRRVLARGSDFLAVSSLADTEPECMYSVREPDYIACLAGDVIAPSRIPWESLWTSFRSQHYDCLSEFRGRFAFAIFDKADKALFLVSDPTSQYPIFYSLRSSYFAFSTAMSSFTRLPEEPALDINWFYEFLFFNFPIGTTTFLQGVKRMPPGSVLRYDIQTSDITISRYAPQLRKENDLLRGKQALEKAVETFRQAVPRYYPHGRRVLHGLSGGFDSRALLGMAPRDAELGAYTYGVPGNSDLRFASDIARRLALPHSRIFFDDAFAEKLSGLYGSVVRFSNGLQGVNRATLLHVYDVLTDSGRQPAAFTNGALGDLIFRGHGNVPAQISFGMKPVFSNGGLALDKELFTSIVGGAVGELEQHVQDAVSRLEKQYGQLRSSDAYLSYVIYEVGPKHWAGEAAIADRFGVFRLPYMDFDLTRLAYEIEYSTISFSKFTSHHPDLYRQNVLHAHLIANNRELAAIPMAELPLVAFSCDNPVLYGALSLSRTIRHAPNRLKSRLTSHPAVPIEDWQNWYRGALRPLLDDLLNARSLVTRYVNAGFLEKIKKMNDIHWLGKMATLEILLQLIQDHWVA